MKAIVFKEYGSPEVLHLAEVSTPQPQEKEILVKIKATAVNSGDWRLRKADPFAVRFLVGLTKPKINILGGVFSGEIVQVGKNVTKFKVGDEVFGSTDMKFGAYSEYKCFPETGIFALKPQNINHLEAAVIPFGATTALDFLKKANLKAGQKVLIYGASGAVGTAAVQLAKYFGAQVTGVCSTSNVELVKSLGADKVIDYTKEDCTKSGETYDIIMDTVNKIAISDCLKVLSKTGILILSAAGLSEMLRGAFISAFSARKVLTGVISQTAAEIEFLGKLVEEVKLKAVIDRTYLLAEMAQAHTYVEKGHKKGNVAILVQ
jgi:NADPH:quinone reductase-like Zn-dependent oxidoreductase